jgi:hypothetical protein
MTKHGLLHFENRNQPLLSKVKFIGRMVRHVLFGVFLILFSLGIGMLGYHFFEGLTWLDALLNASMILGGLGPGDSGATAGGKIFASIYALFSGVLFLVAAGVMVAPVVHRILHRLHMDSED